MTTTTTTVTVRYFAAARAAAGADAEELTLPGTPTVADVVARLGHDRPELARVLDRCSFLLDEIAVRDRTTPVPGGARLDALPPFAGG